MTYEFQSHFADRIKNLLEYRSSMGRSIQFYKSELANFDRFCLQEFPGEFALTRELAFAWCNNARGSRANRAAIIRGFGRYLTLMMEEEAYIMPTSFFPKQKAKLPHILSEVELKRFFDASDRFDNNAKSPILEYTVPTIFRLMFSTGLRPNEARLLRRQNFNFSDNTIYVADTKNGRDRRLAVSAEMMAMAERYDRIAEMQVPGRVYFFQSPTGEAYTNSWLSKIFDKCWARSGNERPPRHCSPYSLRHSYATHTLMRWIEEGKDIDAWIPYLSAYLGHSEFRSTFYYIQLLPERLARMDFTDPLVIPHLEIGYEEEIE